MNVLSLFSGAGGMDLGLEAAGHTVVGMCEIDPKCRELLTHRWPGVELHEDVTTLDGSLFRGRVDVVSGGSPCQDLSVAGRRAGLDGARSGLFWHQCRIADAAAARWVLWENVAGALSSNLGRDFAAVLWGLTGTYPRVPDGGWRTCGVVVGPKRWAVWRLLDARWFGVPQRRRRVFVVAGAGGEPRPEILFEFESSPRGADPCGTSGQDVAALTSTGVGTCGADDNQGQAGHLMPFVKVRRAQHDDDFETWDSGRPAPTLNAMDNTGDTYATVLIPMAFSAGNSAKARSIAVTEEVTPPLRAGASGTNQVPTIMVPTTFSLQPDDRGGFPGALRAVQTDVAPTIAVGDHHSDRGLRIVDPNIAVRRLTPLECERLMGWPDGWTAEGINGPIADSHRFRMCGNGVVASVSEWIGRRLPEATQ